MQLYKVHQRLGAAPPDPRVLDLQPMETPFKKSWVRPCMLCGKCLAVRSLSEIQKSMTAFQQVEK